MREVGLGILTTARGGNGTGNRAELEGSRRKALAGETRPAGELEPGDGNTGRRGGCWTRGGRGGRSRAEVVKQRTGE